MIAIVSSAPMVIAVHPSVPANDLKELTAMLRAAPGRHDYTACNMASPFHFAMEMYKQAVGVFAVHIPHRGCAPATTDAVAGSSVARGDVGFHADDRLQARLLRLFLELPSPV